MLCQPLRDAGRREDARAHADDHCVFVAQLSGAKLWRIFLDGEQFPDLGATLPRPGDDANSFFVTLYAGDVLYVPRGAPHVAGRWTENRASTSRSGSTWTRR